jgi:hypothetical protein
MGYVHDTAMSQFIPPDCCHFVTGTWTETAGAVANTIVKSRGQANAVTTITIPINIPQNSAAGKGSKLVSVEVYWEVLTAALDACAALIYKATLPAHGAEFAAPSSQAFTYDAENDSGADRLDLDQHTMTLTLTTPFWLDNDDLVTVEVIMDAAATSDITFFGARANFTLRL